MRFPTVSARCSTVARAVLTPVKTALTYAHKPVFNGAGACIDAGALVELTFLHVVHASSKGCVRFKGRPVPPVVRTRIIAIQFVMQFGLIAF
jgi:hypothetical protein